MRVHIPETIEANPGGYLPVFTGEKASVVQVLEMFRWWAISRPGSGWRIGLPLVPFNNPRESAAS